MYQAIPVFSYFHNSSDNDGDTHHRGTVDRSNVERHDSLGNLGNSSLNWRGGIDKPLYQIRRFLAIRVELSIQSILDELA